MAKKIRFPLSLSDGTQARTLYELKEHFDLESILGHYKSGKLLTWLRDRYEETEADAVETLDESAPDFQQKLCAIFGVEFSGSGVDMDKIAERQRRLEELRKYTDEDEFIQNIDLVAFDQEELIDLLDEGCEKIYLCGKKFTVPASQKNRAYIGINSPKVIISGNVEGDWAERNITFTGCEVENLSGIEKIVMPPLVSTDDADGPIVIDDELVGDIFEAIYENVPNDVYGREIIAETDHYYVIEEQTKCKDNDDGEHDDMTPVSALRYWRFTKKSCIFEELPSLCRFGFRQPKVPFSLPKSCPSLAFFYYKRICRRVVLCAKQNELSNRKV